MDPTFPMNYVPVLFVAREMKQKLRRKLSEGVFTSSFTLLEQADYFLELLVPCLLIKEVGTP